MTASLPAGLKSADIARFTLRAGQLENIEPVIAYWCMLSSFEADMITKTPYR